MTTFSSSMASQGKVSWSVAVFAARETPDELLKTIRSVIAAATEPSIIDVLVNGNSTLAPQFQALVEAEPTDDTKPAPHQLRIWHIKQGGKGHAWNQYIHALWPYAEITFFVDGYVQPEPDAFALVARHLLDAPAALACTGTPSSGRTAQRIRQEMLDDGGLHGNLFALRSHTIEELRQTHFELALGLYSFDSVLCAILAYGLHPQTKQWDAKGRIIVAPDVTWTTEEKRWWHPADVRTQFKRYMNSAQRVLEREATKYYLQKCKLPIGNFPKRVDDYVLTWMSECPEHAQKTLWRSPLSRLALRKITRPTDWSMAALSPELIHSGKI